MTLSALKETEMTYHEAIAAYLSNLTARAKRLGVARDTLYKWRANPDTANLRLIRNDLAAQLTAINGRLAGIEGKTTAHGRIYDEKQSYD